MYCGAFHWFQLSAILIFHLAAVFGQQDLPSPLILLPANGTSIQPGETFPFKYQSIATQDGISSYLCTCWYFTGAAKGFEITNDFARGHFIGAFVLNHSSPSLSDSDSYDLLPDELTMPDFSSLSVGFGTGESARDAAIFIGVIEEYGLWEPSFGSRMSFTWTQVTYNSSSNR